MTQGCEQCPGNEDVWLEASRLQPPDLAKAVLARGVAQIPGSVKLVGGLGGPVWLRGWITQVERGLARGCSPRGAMPCSVKLVGGWGGRGSGGAAPR